MRRSDSSILAVEIAWLRAAELPRLARIEEILAGGVPIAPPGASSSQPAPTRPPSSSGPSTQASRPAQPARRPDPEPRREPASTAPAPPTVAPNPESPDSKPAGTGKGGGVDGFLERVGIAKAPLAEHLRHLEGLRLVEGGTLEVVVDPDDVMGWSRLDRPRNKEVIDQAVAETWGDEASWRRLRGKGVPKPAETKPPATRAPGEPGPGGPPGTASASEHPDGAAPDAGVGETEQAVLSIFDGMVESVDRDDSESAPNDSPGEREG